MHLFEGIWQARTPQMSRFRTIRPRASDEYGNVVKHETIGWMCGALTWAESCSRGIICQFGPDGGVIQRVVQSSQILRSRLLSCIFAVFATVLMGSGPSLAKQQAIDPELFSQGIVLYNKNCAICHGDNGEGDGPLASGFTPSPANLSSGVFKFRSTGPGEFPTLTDLETTIRNGINGSYGRSMPKFDQFEIDDMRALIEVVRAASGGPDFGTEISAPPRPSSVNFAQGKALYQEFDCIECHGENGNGQGRLALELRDSNGERMKPADFRKGQFKGGNRPEDIWMRIYVGLAGTRMPSYGRGSTGEELWPLVEYVLSFNENN